jgi:hypothetical protein
MGWFRFWYEQIMGVIRNDPYRVERAQYLRGKR